jgi:hypothetical protein
MPMSHSSALILKRIRSPLKSPLLRHDFHLVEKQLTFSFLTVLIILLEPLLLVMNNRENEIKSQKN